MAGKRRKGRVAGVPNLQKTPKGFENMHGVVFTAQEKKALETAVNTAMRKRKRLLDSAAKQPRMVNGRETGQTMGDLMSKFAYESDFILAKKSKSLQQFKSWDEYDNYMKNLKRINQRDYIQKRIELYHENHAKAIMHELNDAETAAKLASLDLNDYLEVSQMYEDTLEIHYVYGSDLRDEKLAAINSALDSFIESKGNKYKTQRREGFQSLLAQQYEATGDARETLRQRATKKKRKKKK